MNDDEKNEKTLQNVFICKHDNHKKVDMIGNAIQTSRHKICISNHRQVKPLLAHEANA